MTVLIKLCGLTGADGVEDVGLGAGEDLQDEGTLRRAVQRVDPAVRPELLGP